MSPVVLEDGVIHHPTRLSMGPAWLTAAIYLNVIGSKLAGGEGSEEGSWGRGLLGNFPEASSHTAPALEGSGCKQGGGAVHGPEPRWPLFLPGDSVGRDGRVFGTQSCPGVRWELGTAAVAKHWQEQKVTVTHLHGYGHEVWSHNPSVFTHLKDI